MLFRLSRYLLDTPNDAAVSSCSLPSSYDARGGYGERQGRDGDRYDRGPRSYENEDGERVEMRSQADDSNNWRPSGGGGGGGGSSFGGDRGGDRGGGYGERGPGPGPNQGREREEFNNDRDGDPPNDWIHDKLVEREKARMKRDFGTADSCREELFKAGHRYI